MFKIDSRRFFCGLARRRYLFKVEGGRWRVEGGALRPLPSTLYLLPSTPYFVWIIFFVAESVEVSTL